LLYHCTKHADIQTEQVHNCTTFPRKLGCTFSRLRLLIGLTVMCADKHHRYTVSKTIGIMTHYTIWGSSPLTKTVTVKQCVRGSTNVCTAICHTTTKILEKLTEAQLQMSPKSNHCYDSPQHIFIPRYIDFKSVRLAAHVK